MGATEPKSRLTLSANAVRSLAGVTAALVSWQEAELQRRQQLAGERYVGTPESVAQAQAGCEELVVMCCRSLVADIIEVTQPDDVLVSGGWFRRHTLLDQQVVVEVQFGASVILAPEYGWMDRASHNPHLGRFRKPELKDWLHFAKNVRYMLA